MVTKFSSGLAKSDDGRSAGREAAERAVRGLDGDDPDFVLVFSSATYDYEQVLYGVRVVVRDATLMGCSSAGEFTESTVESGSVAVSAIASDEMRFFTGLGRGISEDVTGAVAAAAADLPTEVEGYPYLTGINLHDGLAGRAEEIVMLAYQHLPMPFVGGSAADDLALERTYVFAGDEVATDAVALGVVASKKPLSQSVNHGHEPISEPFEVTRVEGNVVHELDGRPAFEVWRDAVRGRAREVYGVDVVEVRADDPVLGELLTRFEFGIETGDGDYKVRWPGPTPDASGPLHFAATIPEGTELRIMHSPKDEQIESAREAGRTAAELADGEVAGALVFDCVCRAAILGEEFEAAVEAIADAVEAPLAGFETYGEVCLRENEMRMYHNTTSSIVVIPE